MDEGQESNYRITRGLLRILRSSLRFITGEEKALLHISKTHDKLTSSFRCRIVGRGSNEARKLSSLGLADEVSVIRAYGFLQCSVGIGR